ncbi:MAG: hypothetical protein L0Z62_16750 [Gemmataceae bacterium]|nr:hypothetical protein [Gemmataceae bacterium]
MLTSHKALLPWSVPLLLVALAGCSEGPQVVPVSGILTYKGKPVSNAFVFFQPEDGRPSVGETDDEGRFKLNYDRRQDGALVGKHKVSVKMRPEQEAVMLGKKPPRMSRELHEFFDKYSAEKSKIEVEIAKKTTDLKLDWQ